MKKVDNEAPLRLRQAMSGAMKSISLVVAGIAGMILTIIAVIWLTNYTVDGLETVWPLHSWAVIMTACGIVWCLVLLSEFTRLTLNGAGVMQKEKYDIWTGVYFGTVVILSWALCAALFWMLFHLQGDEGGVQVPLIVISVFTSMLYPFILFRLIRDN